MTRRELSQLYYLHKEIEQKTEQLEQLEATIANCTSLLSDMPRGSNYINDKMADKIADIVDVKQLIEIKKLECVYESRRLYRYIETISDSNMRLILQLRYLKGQSWEQIAAYLGQTTSSAVRCRHDRHLARVEEE